MRPLASDTAITLSEGVENWAIRAGAAISASISTGMRRVVMIKLFFATRSENSREIIMPMFDCMGMAG